MELKYPKFVDHLGNVEQFARATVVYHKFERTEGRNTNQRHFGRRRVKQETEISVLDPVTSTLQRRPFLA
eukprot:scaffold2482_cov196-Alexandrium_tamarense.AAC.21